MTPRAGRGGPGPQVQYFDYGKKIAASLERRRRRRTGRGQDMPFELWLPELVMKAGEPVGIDWHRTLPGGSRSWMLHGHHLASWVD